VGKTDSNQVFDQACLFLPGPFPRLGLAVVALSALTFAGEDLGEPFLFMVGVVCWTKTERDGEDEAGRLTWSRQLLSAICHNADGGVPWWASCCVLGWALLRRRCGNAKRYLEASGDADEEMKA